MDTQNFFMFLKPSHFCFLLIIYTNLANHAASLYEKYQACSPRTCGNGPNISYPFWIADEQQSFCGYPNFHISCRDKNPVLTISNDDYIIKDIFYSNHSLLVANYAVYEDTCPTPLYNISLDRTPFNLTLDHSNFSIFYNCTSEPDYPTYSLDCASNGTHSFAVFHEEELVRKNYSLDCCDSLVDVPVDILVGLNFTSLLQMSYTEVLKIGFLLNWSAPNCGSCQTSGGRCGFDNKEFVCFCQDGAHPKTCNDADINWRAKVGIAVGASVGSVAIMCIIFWIRQRRYKKKHAPSPFVSRSMSPYPSSVTDSDVGSRYFGVPLFTYAVLERATNNFDSSNELGEGGFGTVYYGKLRDGREVAVKRLFENNCRRMEQFKNEVVILTGLRHQNLVSLYGCTSRHSRELLLVYEYIPNGTVADHIHGEKAKPGGLPWTTRMKIAVETASALTYLHASDVIHRDVKTNNILLDNHFCVKVADFGLSRLFPTDVTHISTAPQGTPGYVDPEYHQCYQLTDKSDVFSFGVVLIELISSLPAMDITRHRHEINLSNMAINKIQNNALQEFVDPSLGFESDYTIRRMITAVAELAFECLQSAQEMRPSMQEVLKRLEDIRNKDYGKDKAEEIRISADDAVLLGRDSLPLSPDSARLWTSSSTLSISSS